MTLTVTIAMDNAAFGGSNGTEAARILHKLADRLHQDELGNGFKMRLLDVNGNKVGAAEVTK